MKTLDEVIWTLDYCKKSSDCNPCPYLKDKECIRVKLTTDASYYLKMYRSDKLQWEADRKMWEEKGPEIEKK